jgi:hypothetical protein
VRTAAATEQQNFHVDGTFHVLYTHGSDLGATAGGTVTVGSQKPLPFTINTEVKLTGYRIHGAPTMVFTNGSTLTFDYEIKEDRATGIFSGSWTVVNGTGEFAGASGGGFISYPVSDSGPLTMDGKITT